MLRSRSGVLALGATLAALTLLGACSQGTVVQPGDPAASSSALQEHPAAAKNLFVAVPQGSSTVTRNKVKVGDDSQIITPSGVLAITSIAQTSTVTDPSTGKVSQAAPGYTLWQIDATWTPGAQKADIDTQTTSDGQSLDNSSLPDTTISYVDGGTQVDTKLLGSNGSESASGGDGETLIASIKNGKDASLEASSAGVDQTISVTTGKRASNPQTAGFYVANREYGADQTATVTDVNDSSSCTTFGCPDYDVKYAMTVSNVTITAFDYLTSKWADAGQEFVETAFQASNDGLSGGDSSYQYTYAVDESGWSATVGGKAYSQAKMTTVQGSNNNVSLLTGNGTFLIPAGSTSVAMSMPNKVTMGEGNTFSSSGLPAPPAPFVASTLTFTATFG